MSDYKISVDDIDHLMNYQSPVELAVNKWTDELVKQEDNCIMAQIKHQIGVAVDKDELIKALNYDREQYRKGFREGYELYERENIVRCKNCIHARHNETFPEKYECRFSSTLRKKDDYCSEGEREEDFK